MNYFKLLEEVNKGDKDLLVLDSKVFSYNKVIKDVIALSSAIKTYRREIICIKSEIIYFEFIGFLAINKNGDVPLILHPSMSKEVMDEIMKENKINYILTKDGIEKKFDFKRSLKKEYCNATLTSGTSSVPKLLFRSFESYYNFFKIQNEVFKIDENTKMFFHGSLSFTGNLNSILSVLYEGGTVITYDKFNPKAWVRTIKDEKVNTIYLVPTKLKSLNHVIKGSIDGIITIFTGSQQLFSDLKEDLQKKFNNTLTILYYGASEISYVTFATLEDIIKKPLSVGKPFKGIDITIRDDYIYVSSDYFAEGINKPYTVMDLGLIDKDGDLIFLGRKSDVINKGGISINIIKVESLIKSLDFIDDCSIVPYYSKDKGEDMALFIKCNRSVTKKQIRKSLLNKLIKNEVPKKIFIIDEIPLNDSGKIEKIKLKKYI